MENVGQKTGVIYCRVSSKEQVDNTSLAMQERVCNEFAQREGIEVLQTFIEEGESAKTANRTEFQKALSFCSDKKKQVDYFIVYKIDRFARNQDDHFATQLILRRCGVKLRSVTEHIDESPIGRLMEGVLSSVAEFDNNVRSGRSKAATAERVRQGIYVWQAPIGYTRIVKGGNLVVEEENREYIRLCFEEWAKGTHSYASLAKYLGDRGFHTRRGKFPCAQLIEKILHNPVYCAVIRTGGQEINGTFEAIVSRSLYLTCQPNGRKKFLSGNRKQDNPMFPLRRFAVCTMCNKSITGSSSTGRKGIKYPYYHHQKQDCEITTSIPKETLEQNFVEYLQEISPTKRYEKIFKAVVLDVWQSNYKKLDSENVRIEKEIENLKTARQSVFDMHRAGKYSDDEFLEQKKLINLKIHQKELLRDEKKIEEFDMEEALSFAFGLIRESAKTWKDLEKLPAYRARFQNNVFPEKVTFDGKKFGTKKIALIYKLNQDSVTEKSRIAVPTGIEPVFTH
jgi:site-specific DNA recombinase